MLHRSKFRDRKSFLNYLDDQLYAQNFDLVNIYVKNIPGKMDIKNLEEKFSRFGSIVDVRINKIYKQAFTPTYSRIAADVAARLEPRLEPRLAVQSKRTKYTNRASAFIQFAQPESALKAIKLKKIDGILINESYKQPEKDVPDFDENFLLEKLNDDCLLHLFCYLQFEDHINLTKISNRQKSLVQYYYKVSKTFNENNINLNHTTLSAIHNFLMENGKSIENLILLKPDRHIFRHKIINFALKYCPNIETLKVEGYFPKLDFEMIIKTFLCLKTLHLGPSFQIEINISDSLKSNNIETLILNGDGGRLFVESLIRTLPNLKQLCLHNVRINGTILRQFPKYLQNLEILRVTSLDDDSIQQLCVAVEGMPMLKKLGVEFDFFITGLNLLSGNHLVEILEILHVRFLSYEQIDQLKKFVNLKELTIGLAHNILSCEEFWRLLTRLIKCNLEKLEFQYSRVCRDYIDIKNLICLKLIRILNNNNLSKIITLIPNLDGKRSKIILNKYGVVSATNSIIKKKSHIKVKDMTGMKEGN